MKYKEYFRSLHLPTLRNKQMKDDKGRNSIWWGTRHQVGFGILFTTFYEFNRPAIVWICTHCQWTEWTCHGTYLWKKMKSTVVWNWQPINVHYFPLTPNSWHHFLLPLAQSLHLFVQPPSQSPSPLVLEAVLPPFQLLASSQMCFAAQLLHCLHTAASCHEVVLDMTTGSGKQVMDTAAILPSQDWDSLMSHTGLEPWIVQSKRLIEQI